LRLDALCLRKQSVGSQPVLWPLGVVRSEGLVKKVAGLRGVVIVVLFMEPFFYAPKEVL